jgi:hypothetical protein
MPRLLPVVAILSLLLAGCDQLGIESASVTAEKKAAEGKAVGAACRHAGRAIEDCYTLNKKADKASIYTGWREMDDYMRENKLEPVLPVIKPEDLKPKPKPVEGEEADAPADGGKADGHAADAKSNAKKAGAH